MSSASSASASFEPANVLLGNHQHVRRSLRIDIVEGVGMLVFVNFLGGYFPANDAAEQAVVHDTVHSSKFGDTPRCNAEVARTGKARAHYTRSEKVLQCGFWFRASRFTSI